MGLFKSQIEYSPGSRNCQLENAVGYYLNFFIYMEL
jgi:hypothetical protein